MVAPVVPSVSAIALLVHFFVDKEREEEMRAAVREFRKFRDVAGLDQHRREHFDGTAMTYHRGRWHGAVSVLCASAGIETPTGETELLDYGRILSAHLPGD